MSSGTPIGQVTASGFVRPDFPYTLNSWQSGIRAIYGQDVYLGEDCQDGQLASLEAQGIYDAGGVALSVFNSFSPATGIGTGLDRNAKLNGIRRKRATYSTAPLRIVGQAGVAITNGLVTDPAGYVWALPASVLIPYEGEIVVIATCQTIGAIKLPVGALDTAAGKGSIATVTRGWQSAANVSASSVGQPVESDSALRQRQAISTALPSLSIADGLLGALAAISGVTRLKVYENDEGYPSLDGIPGHSIAAVVDGGDPAVVGQVIRLKKGSAGTYGSTLQSVTDASGVAKRIRFSYLSLAPVGYAVTVQRLPGYTQSIENQWKASLASWVGGLDIGEDVERDQAFAAAKLYDAAGAKTFRILSFKQARVGFTPTTDDVDIGLFEAATCDPADIAVTVLPS